MLQSQRFTRLPRIEPALSAAEFVGNLGAEERERYLSSKENYLPPAEKIPPAVARRIQEFVRALDKPAPREDERLGYFRKFLRQNIPTHQAASQYLTAQYARSMKFLYEKEFVSQQVSGSGKSSFVASLYQERGHSTDTQIEANYAVYTALSVLKALSAAPTGKVTGKNAYPAPTGKNAYPAFNRVLIVGPGLDFAPRTDLMDIVPPQSYQPFAVADALLGLGLADPKQLRIHCLDIHPRVIQFLQEFPKRKAKRLTIFSGVRESERRSWTLEYREYFQKLGKNVGRESASRPPPNLPPSHLWKTLTVRAEMANRITAERMNILTERYEPSPAYDLVVVTNVFTYFNATELALALANIQALLKPGGYLVHNELREDVEVFGKAQGLEPVQARTLRLTAGEETPLFDSFVIHKKM
jgi:SAM-dependent methyltransferase